MILEVGKRYVMRNGELEKVVRFNSVPPDSPFYAIGEWNSWTGEGEYYGCVNDSNDIVAGYRPMPLAIVGFRRP